MLHEGVCIKCHKSFRAVKPRDRCGKCPRPPRKKKVKPFWDKGEVKFKEPKGIKLRRKAREILKPGDKCSICKRRLARHVYHIKPISAGGTNHYRNLIKLCRKCHADKHPELPKKLFTRAA